ncbi:subunit SPC12 of microsomal signal peptidase [Chloropicon roscoffensis]|uniref:Signal peptidase complex subunit 1 n=1 Tax=Chloropicon roscoffensis TaxID=1461544 RepID=A0AAX4PMM8_9CHLO
MDLKGQQLCEALATYLILFSAIVAFLFGIGTQSLRNLFCVYGAGVGLTCLVIIPNWPFYNRNPMKWLPRSLKKD